MINWIKCSEEMPKRNQRVLVFIPDFKRHGLEIDINHLKDEWGSGELDWDCFSMKKITHWAVLPDHPEK